MQLRESTQSYQSLRFCPNEDGHDKGVALIEFAICLVLLVMLASASLDFGIAMREHAVMVEAARVAARTAVRRQDLDGPGVSDIALATARNILGEKGLDSADYGISIESQSLALTAGQSMGIRIVISRPAENRFRFFNAVESFMSCVSSTFLVESGVTPESRGQSPAC